MDAVKTTSKKFQSFSKLTIKQTTEITKAAKQIQNSIVIPPKILKYKQ